MEQLRLIGSEDGSLVLATESGDRFGLVVDDVLRSELRRSHRVHEERPRGPRPSPRDIQARIRAGMSAADVAQALGITTDDVSRYEGPVLAERDHIVDMALAVPVLVAGDIDHDTMPTFGTAVRVKLTDADASGERWSSWKEPSGWVVKLEFRAADVEHDARWDFDPRRGTLSPRNADATQLSRQGSLPEGLIPRLRALDAPPVSVPAPDDTVPARPVRLPADEATTSAVQEAAIKRAPEASHTTTQTADLLEALRRRRGQRTAPTADADAPVAVPPPVALFDAFDVQDDEPSRTRQSDDTAASSSSSGVADGRRKGRTAMPSWDEIVFGARTEDS